MDANRLTVKSQEALPDLARRPRVSAPAEAGSVAG